MFNEINHLVFIYLNSIEFFGDHLQLFIIISCFVFLVIIEMILTHDQKSKSLIIQSYLTNTGMFIFNNLFFSLLSVSTILVIAERYHYKGLLTDYNPTVQALGIFVLFDLLLYFWHKCCHDYDFLWHFHKVHHSDQSMNVSTAFRVHIIEVFLTQLLKVVLIIVTGVEVVVLALCEAISTCFVMFHHLNISFNHEKWLKWIIIVPSLHRVHHSVIRSEHDSNYGAVFSVWDRLFRTYRVQKPVEIGLLNIKTLNIYQLIKFGLLSDKPVSAVAKQYQVDNINLMIKEAAYYHAEKRGFVPGFETIDWIEAEKQIVEGLG